MSEEAKEKQELQEVKLTITLKPDTKYPSVEGPLHNEPLCFYLLKYAELSIIQHNNKPPQIIDPKGGIMNFVRKRF